MNDAKTNPNGSAGQADDKPHLQGEFYPELSWHIYDDPAQVPCGMIRPKGSGINIQQKAKQSWLEHILI